jgi:hypothetical protein
MVFFGPRPVGDELVVVLPSADGHVGTVVVERGGEQIVLNRAFAASRIVDGGQHAALRVRKRGCETRGFPRVALGALAASAPRTFTAVLPEKGTDDADGGIASVEFAAILAELRKRRCAGRLGHRPYRQGRQRCKQTTSLSLQRAERVKQRAGGPSAFPPERIRTAGRGKRRACSSRRTTRWTSRATGASRSTFARGERLRSGGSSSCACANP